MASKEKKPASTAKSGEGRKTPKVPEAIGFMEGMLWSGIPMWRCIRCGGTTFDKEEAPGHKCSAVKPVPDRDDD